MTLLQLSGRLFRFSPGYYLLSLLMQILRLGLLMAPGPVIRRLFDLLSAGSGLTWGFWAMIAVLIALALTRVVALLAAIAVEFTCYFISSGLLRTNLFAHLLHRPDARSLPFPVGDIVNRLDKDAGLPADVLRSGILTIGAAVGAILSITIMLSIDAHITSIVLIPLLGAGIVTSSLGNRLMDYRRQHREAEGQVRSFLGEAFSAVQALQVATAETNAVKHLHELNVARRKAAIKDRVFNDVLLNFFLTNITELCTAIILLVAGSAIRAGSISVGELALFVYLMPRVADLTLYFGQALAFFQQARVSLERLKPIIPNSALLVEPRPIPMKSTAHAYVEVAEQELLVAPLARLRISNLSYHYPDTGRGVDKISFTVRGGSFTVITGRIGSGKTTLLRALLGLLPKDAGEVRWNDSLIEDPASFFVPPRSAYTPQEPRLFSDTLRDNIAMGLMLSDAEIDDALRRAVLATDVDAFEKGVNTQVGRRGVRLSGGQIQRTAAARMLVRGAQLLVIDDISSALDVDTERLLWQHLSDRQKAEALSRSVAVPRGRPLHLSPVTCLIVSHRRAALQCADQIILLKDGRVEAEGTLTELLRCNEEMKRLWQGDVGA